MNGDEYALRGGLPTTLGDGADVYLEECGPIVEPGHAEPLTYTLRFVTGVSDYCLGGLEPKGLLAFGKWLQEVVRNKSVHE